jgi:hypothetical protein
MVYRNRKRLEIGRISAISFFQAIIHTKYDNIGDYQLFKSYVPVLFYAENAKPLGFRGCASSPSR